MVPNRAKDKEVKISGVKVPNEKLVKISKFNFGNPVGIFPIIPKEAGSKNSTEAIGTVNNATSVLGTVLVIFFESHI